jgi:hypothetical protein
VDECKALLLLLLLMLLMLLQGLIPHCGMQLQKRTMQPIT